ncbi:hypothetical protein F5884DRAFT_899597 [Xylogone sp. PMI_703]|nr:hypothetical protein F5884DRAFT_899597 [Xylogone sp. PMI_703]
MSTIPYTAELAAFVANATVTNISSTFLALLPLFILDTSSAIISGLVQPVYRSAVTAVRITYGHSSGEETYITVDGTPSSLSGAILLNGLTAGDFEFEHVISNAHPASAVFPALLTVAAAHHKTGEDFLVAITVGYELAARIKATSTTTIESEKGFHNPGLNEDLTTTVTVGRLMS